MRKTEISMVPAAAPAAAPVNNAFAVPEHEDDDAARYRSSRPNSGTKRTRSTTMETSDVDRLVLKSARRSESPNGPSLSPTTARKQPTTTNGGEDEPQCVPVMDADAAQQRRLEEEEEEYLNLSLTNLSWLQVLKCSQVGLKKGLTPTCVSSSQNHKANIQSSKPSKATSPSQQQIKAVSARRLRRAATTDGTAVPQPKSSKPAGKIKQEPGKLAKKKSKTSTKKKGKKTSSLSEPQQATAFSTGPHPRSSLPGLSGKPLQLQIGETPNVDWKINASIKPPHAYATLIYQAIVASKNVHVTLGEVYAFIEENFMYYRLTDSGWKNSIRHNLSQNECFKKVTRPEENPGKGGFWMLDPRHLNQFENGVLTKTNKKAGKKICGSDGPTPQPTGRLSSCSTSTSTSSLQLDSALIDGAVVDWEDVMPNNSYNFDVIMNEFNGRDGSDSYLQTSNGSGKRHVADEVLAMDTDDLGDLVARVQSARFGIESTVPSSSSSSRLVVDFTAIPSFEDIAWAAGGLDDDEGDERLDGGKDSAVATASSLEAVVPQMIRRSHASCAPAATDLDASSSLGRSATFPHDLFNQSLRSTTGASLVAELKLADCLVITGLNQPQNSLLLGATLQDSATRGSSDSLTDLLATPVGPMHSGDRGVMLHSGNDDDALDNSHDGLGSLLTDSGAAVATIGVGMAGDAWVDGCLSSI